MRYTDFKRTPSTIKIIKNTYLDGINGTTMVKTASTAAMEAEDGDSLTQNTDRRKKKKHKAVVTYGHDIWTRHKKKHPRTLHPPFLPLTSLCSSTSLYFINLCPCLPHDNTTIISISFLQLTPPTFDHIDTPTFRKRRLSDKYRPYLIPASSSQVTTLFLPWYCW